MLSSFLLSFASVFSSAFRLVGSALLLWNASLSPHVVSPNGPPTIPVPNYVCFSSYCGRYSLIGSRPLEPALIPLWTPLQSSNHTIYTAPLTVTSL